MSILDRFKSITGLAINRNKSEVVGLGYYKAHPPDINSTGLSFSFGPFKTLGICFSASMGDIFEFNYLPKEKLINILKVWSMRYFTPIGKIVILKSLALSQLIFLLSVLPSPPEPFMKEIDDIIYSFLWDNKPDKLSRRTIIIGDYSQGGLKMFHFPSVNAGLKIAWIKRLLNNQNTGKWRKKIRLSLTKIWREFDMVL